jgi:N-acetyl-beta-hexosaminidase
MYLLPVPQKLSYHNEEFLIQYDTNIILNSTLGFQELGYAKILQNQIKDSISCHLNITKAGKEEANSIYLNRSILLKPEEYHLVIREKLIELTGGSSEALLYGISTLRQIIVQKGAVLPGIDILDYPEIKNRGFYHDVTRGRIPTLETLKALADKLSYYKLNQLQLYIEHSFLFKDFSEVWRDDTPLTAEEILELDSYCSSINIELVPSIASFGHLHKVLSTKTYEELCELEGSSKERFSYMSRMEHHTVDVTNEGSFELVQKMLLEYLPLFSSKLFNICADETFDLGKGKSKPMAEAIGTDRMYIDFLKKLCEMISDQGKQPMFWGDIIAANPEAIKELPENVICLNWDYSTDASDRNIKKLSELGVVQYLCPGVQGWRRLMNHLKNGYDNISLMSKYAHQYKAAGLLNTDWGDYGHVNHPEFSTTGMIYGAVFSWNSDPLEFDDINRRISVVEYGDRSESFVAAINRASSQEGFLWSHAVQFKELSQRNISPEEKKEFFQQFDTDQLLQMNEEIAAAVKDIYQGMVQMELSKREVVKPYLVAARGMEIFNRIGAVIGQHILDSLVTVPIEISKLAADLEYWFLDYKEIWRNGYKEAELYRIAEVIVWYADYLREIQKNKY